MRSQSFGSLPHLFSPTKTQAAPIKSHGRASSKPDARPSSPSMLQTSTHEFFFPKQNSTTSNCPKKRSPLRVREQLPSDLIVKEVIFQSLRPKTAQKPERKPRAFKVFDLNISSVPAAKLEEGSNSPMKGIRIIHSRTHSLNKLGAMTKWSPQKAVSQTILKKSEKRVDLFSRHSSCSFVMDNSPSKQVRFLDSVY